MVGYPCQSLSDVTAKHDDLANTHLDNIAGGFNEAAAIGQTLAGVLPGKYGKSVGDAANALSTTVTAIADLRKGDLAGAAAAARILREPALRRACRTG